MRGSAVCIYGHPRTPETIDSSRRCMVCRRMVVSGRGHERVRVADLCRARLHDLSDPTVVRVNAKGRYCGPCAKAAAVARLSSRVRYGPHKRYMHVVVKVERPPRDPNLCKNGHDKTVVGVYAYTWRGRQMASCMACTKARKVAQRKTGRSLEERRSVCVRGHSITGDNRAAPRQGHGTPCRECRRLNKRVREWKHRSARPPGVRLVSIANAVERMKKRATECFYCRASGVELTVDHVVPLARNGAHSEGNLVMACRPCNSSKSDSLLVEWKARAA